MKSKGNEWDRMKPKGNEGETLGLNFLSFIQNVINNL